MKVYIKMGNGQLVELDDLFDEDNWQPRTRNLASWLFVAGVGAAFYLVIYFA